MKGEAVKTGDRQQAAKPGSVAALMAAAPPAAAPVTLSVLVHQNPPMVASGIRIGTPAVTTRGMAEPEMDTIASFIDRALRALPPVAPCAVTKNSMSLPP